MSLVKYLALIEPKLSTFHQSIVAFSSMQLGQRSTPGFVHRAIICANCHRAFACSCAQSLSNSSCLLAGSFDQPIMPEVNIPRYLNQSE